MTFSTNEILIRAAKFVEEWKDAHYEKGETQSFYNDFFEIFGKKRRDVATYEKQVTKLNNNKGFIDLFWPKVLLIEQKSKGRDLNKAMEQADEYFLQLEEELRPRYMLTCDFQNWHLVDLDERIEYNFKLSELHDNIECFNFMRGLTQEKIIAEDPVNLKAADMMGKIYDILDESGYPLNDTHILLTRLTYCLFADDSGIFESQILQKYFKNRTSEDGSDLGAKLIQLFQVLNKEQNSRQSNLDEDLAKFPFINGNLFKENIDIPAFNSKMRNLLIEASEYNWSKVSPAIFGSLFQTVMNPEARRESGSHFTSESNIMKVIKPLFLDELVKEFETINSRKDNHRIKELLRFQTKLSNLKFLDPACGAGNFLIIAYREIRKLELKVIEEVHDKSKELLVASTLSKVDVDQFFGIEINEFSSRIAEVALWMMDHLMNNELSKINDVPFSRIPLKNHPNIVNKDALEIDWNELLPSSECSYIFGNPPYGGANQISPKQKSQMNENFKFKNIGKLDYVCCWLFKACQYVDKNTQIAFVTTNSITQGEQVEILWDVLIEKYNTEINFAYKQFKWDSEARGKAHVIVIILGLSKNSIARKRLFFHENEKIIEANPNYISPYLIGSNVKLPIVKKIMNPINGLPKLKDGAAILDNNNFRFTPDEMSEFLNDEPHAKKWFKPFINAENFINGKKLWILSLKDIQPNEIQNLPKIKKCINAVKEYRMNRSRPQTKKLADTPTYFAWGVVPTTPFLVIPRATSERREYIPIGYLKPPIIPTNQLMVIEDAKIEVFGILTSKLHMVWLRFIGGKLKTDSRYSSGMVYNTFPLPDTKLDSLKSYAQKILDVREKYKDSTMENLYDPDSMPPDLKKAHVSLDSAVEKLYRKKSFNSDHERFEFLLSKYNDAKENP